MFVFVVHLLLLVSARYIVAYQDQCISIYSEDNKELKSLTWAVGVPNITIVIVSRMLYQYDTIFYLKNDFSSRPIAWSSPSFLSAFSLNETLINVQSNTLTNKTFNFTLTFLRPNLINGHFISVSQRSCYSKTSPIRIIHCPQPEGVVVSTKTRSKWNYKSDVKVGRPCNNSVYVGSTTNAVIGRYKKITCGAKAKWTTSNNQQCWSGSFIDLMKGERVRTFKAGEWVLLFCEVTDQTIGNVAIQGRNIHSSGKMMAWSYVHLSSKNNNGIMTCHQTSLTSSQIYSKSVRLEVLFSPLLSEVYTRDVILNQYGHAIIEFESNPAISGVTATKQGKEVKNIYKRYDRGINKVALLFPEASRSDLGEYNVTTESGPPFNTSQHFLVLVRAVIAASPTTISVSPTYSTIVPKTSITTSVSISVSTSVFFYPLIGVTILLLLVTTLGTLKHFGLLCFKARPNAGSPQLQVRYDRDNDGVQGQAENQGNYMIPMPDGNPGFELQENCYENSLRQFSQQRDPQQESAYETY